MKYTLPLGAHVGATNPSVPYGSSYGPGDFTFSGYPNTVASVRTGSVQVVTPSSISVNLEASLAAGNYAVEVLYADDATGNNIQFVRTISWPGPSAPTPGPGPGSC